MWSEFKTRDTSQKENWSVLKSAGEAARATADLEIGATVSPMGVGNIGEGLERNTTEH